MKSIRDIKQSIKKLKVQSSDEIHDRILEKSLRMLDESKKQMPPEEANIGRIIMKSRITKFAAATVIVIAAVFSVTLFDKFATPAYAIEQTIEAFRKVNSVYVEQIIREKDKLLNAKMWARRSRDGQFFFGDFRQETENGSIIVADESENRTYYYNPSTNRVRVYERLNVTIGNFLDKNFYVHLREEMEDVQIDYDKDKATGKQIVILKCKVPIPSKYDQSVCKSGVITFDLQSKLPLLLKAWDNPDFKGQPYMQWSSIEYNPKIPEGTFKFETPEDATVITE